MPPDSGFRALIPPVPGLSRPMAAVSWALTALASPSIVSPAPVSAPHADNGMMRPNASMSVGMRV